MGWDFSATLTTVHFGDAVGIQWPTLVRIDDNTEEARVGLKEKKWRLETDRNHIFKPFNGDCRTAEQFLCSFNPSNNQKLSHALSNRFVLSMATSFRNKITTVFFRNGSFKLLDMRQNEGDKYGFSTHNSFFFVKLSTCFPLTSCELFLICENACLHL